MKKIFQIAAVLFFCYYLLLLFWDYSNLLENTLNKDVIKVEMTNNSEITNQKYIEKIKNICKETDTSLYYRMYNKKTMTYYIVDENHNFFEMNLNEKLDRNQYLTTKGTKGHQMNYICINKVCELRNIDEIREYKLDAATFYVKTKNYNAFDDCCEKNGISLEKLEMTTTRLSAVNFENMMIAVALMALVFIMYNLSIKRNVFIRRMSGFSDVDNFFYSMKKEIKLIGIPCACLFVTACAIMAIFYPRMVVSFMELYRWGEFDNIIS